MSEILFAFVNRNIDLNLIVMFCIFCILNILYFHIWGRPFVMCPDKGHSKSPAQEKVIDNVENVDNADNVSNI